MCAPLPAVQPLLMKAMTPAIKATAKKMLLQKVGTGLMIGGSVASGISAVQQTREAKEAQRTAEKRADAGAISEAQGSTKAKTGKPRRPRPGRRRLYT